MFFFACSSVFSSPAFLSAFFTMDVSADGPEAGYRKLPVFSVSSRSRSGLPIAAHVFGLSRSIVILAIGYTPFAAHVEGEL